MHNFDPFVSVIITCYNREREIERAIKSVQNQDYSNFEIIVVDDCSSDRSVDLIRRSFPVEVKLITHLSNKGQNSAIKTGLLQAKGEFIAFLDSDDIWLPSFLTTMINSFSEEIGFVYCWIKNGPRSFLSERSNYYDVLDQGYLSSMITIVVRKCCFNDIDYFPDHYSICQDDKLCFELARRFKFKLVPQELAYVIGSKNSMTRNYVNLAHGWSKFFRDYESEILKYCGHRTLAKHQVTLANIMIQAGFWSSGFYLYVSAAYNTFKKIHHYNKFGPAKIPYILFALLNSSKFRFKYCIKKLLRLNKL